MKKEDGASKYLFFGLLGLIALVSGLIIYPFLTSIIGGAILAFLFHPFYEWMVRRIKSRGIAAFLTAVIIILIVTVPLIFLINQLTQETHYLYIRAKQQVFSGEFIETRCYEDTFICKTINNANDWLKDDNIKNYLVDRLNEFLSFVTKRISDLIFTLPKIILYLMVALFTTYYVLKDGKEFTKRLEQIVPLKVHHQEQITKQFGDVTKAVIYGSFLVAIAQGALGAFGFWLFGLNGFIWWGIVMTFFALIPFIGTWIIWMPASGFLALTGYLQGENALIWKGAGLFFYGLLIISTVDNILKPFIVAGRARVHPLLVIIGILGGLFLFGFMGLIIGPLVLAMMQTLCEIYEREKTHHLDEPEPDILGHKNHKNRKHKK